ncbi:hypothetical protein SMICM304S_09724 [Streptomyces microflavus]
MLVQLDRGVGVDDRLVVVGKREPKVVFETPPGIVGSAALGDRLAQYVQNCPQAARCCHGASLFGPVALPVTVPAVRFSLTSPAAAWAPPAA